ncbi:DUF4429 domain-containing protein [Streptomyces sp. TLI_105]|uniref:DUF4429 domain-containing protein n=1 Tax=Streptomyces sp. TLI_105 TaxID=1881019 RepID=UPI00089AE430|nr:DUF4429 domain-containing protein [Streptomyces sp. TLI_105]SED45574.1 protein of unknown function [Streptomyces sp. TLI_105]
MGDVLAGIHATWELERDALVIRFDRGIRTPKLFGALRERRVPHEALASVTLTPGKRGTVVLHAVPRPGADPLMEAAAGQLKEGSDPYRLVLPAERETLAEHYRDELRALLASRPGAAGAAGHEAYAPGDGEAGGVAPTDRFLVAPPPGPQSFKAYDGKASFDGTSEVAFRWSWTGASSEKWKAGDQVFSVRDLCGVEWRSPDGVDGYLRLVPRDGGSRAVQPDQDPACVVFGRYGPVYESLTFAAAVLAAIRGKDRAPVPVAVPAGGRGAGHRDPGAVAERIRHLGELHRAGLVTDAEFSAKKAELLAEL